MIALMVLFLTLASGIQNIEAQQDSISVNITTNPALLKNRFVCPGINVTFTCKTRGSETIAWSSEQYIGEGNSMLIFAHGMDAVDSTQMKLNGHTVAKFTRDNLENGERVLESTLRINTTMRRYLNLRNASITCIEDNQSNRSRSIEFQVVADPGNPEQLFAFQVSHPATNRGSCIVTVVWHSSINISGDEIQHYDIFANAINVSRDTIVSSTSINKLEMASVLFLPGCMEHNITVREVNICDRHGQESDPYPLDPKQCPCDTAVTTVTTKFNDACGTTVTNDGRLNGGNRGPFVMLLTLLILFSGIIYYILC